MMVHFSNTFVDTMTQAKARNKLTKLRMEGGHIDKYIAKFKRYVTMAGYGVDEPTVLEKFIKGLPTPLAHNCVEMDNPDSWDKWKESASQKTPRGLHPLATNLGCKRYQERPTLVEEKGFKQMVAGLQQQTC